MQFLLGCIGGMVLMAIGLPLGGLWCFVLALAALPGTLISPHIDLGERPILFRTIPAFWLTLIGILIVTSVWVAASIAFGRFFVGYKSSAPEWLVWVSVGLLAHAPIGFSLRSWKSEDIHTWRQLTGLKAVITASWINTVIWLWLMLRPDHLKSVFGWLPYTQYV